jgi:hypothetical protein
MRTILGPLVIAVILVGCGGAAGTQPPSASVEASSSGTLGGSVTYQVDGAPATTEVDVVADGAGLSGSAVSTFATGTHTVDVECAAAADGGWMLGGKVESTTIPGETAGAWSAVIVRDGSPQQIAIWLSAGPEAGDTCDAFLASIDPATLDASAFSDIDSGELIPPG